jgi:hypothetical protein
MKYICKICNKEFSQKSHYDVHNNKKFPCDSKNDVINKSNKNPTKNTILPQNPTKPTILPQNPTILPQNPTILPTIINTSNLTCKFCNKIYSRNDSLTRHINLYCKKKNKLCNEENTIQLLLEQNKQIMEEHNKEFIKELKKLRNENHTLNETLQTISQVSKSKKINSNYSHNNNNNTNNIQNNFIVNGSVNFGDEDISKISDDSKLKALKSLSKAFINYVQVVNLNEDHPENQNVLINNIRSNTGSVIEDNKIIQKSQIAIIDDVINTRLPEIEALANKYKTEKKLSKKEYDFLEEIIDFLRNSFIETEDVDGNMIKGDKDMIKKLKGIQKDLIYLFYNNRTMVRQNMKQLLVDPLVDPIMKLIDDNNNN